MRLFGFALAISLSTVGYGQFLPLHPVGERVGDPPDAYLNITATDASGKAIPDLTAADFSLSQDSKELAVRKLAGPAAAARSVVAVVDDMGLSPAGMNRVRQGLQEFLRSEWRPEVRAAIVRTSGGSASLLRLTSDRKMLAAQLERIVVHPYADATGAQAPAFLTGTMQGLRAVISALSGLEGRKVVVLFSERMALTGTPDGQAGTAAEAIAIRCAELAQMAGVVFYAVNLRAENSTAASIVQIETGIAGIASETGGLVLDSSSGISPALQRVMQDFAGAYRLGFQSETHDEDFTTGVPIYRKLAVRTARPGVILRAPAAVYGASKSNHGNEIVVNVTPIFLYEPASGQSLNLLVHIDGKSVASVRDLKGNYTVLLDTDVTAFDGNGQAGTDAKHPGSAAMPQGGYEVARREGIAYPIRIPVRGAGLRRVEVRVTDPAGGHAGVGSEVVAVPATANGALTMSGIVLATDEQHNLPEQEIREGAAVRHYHAGSTFRYGYDIYNLTRGPEKQSSLEMQIRLLHYGQSVSAIPPRTLSIAPSQDSDRRTISGIVRTGKDLKPGYYVLAITSVDKFAPKPREVTQYTDFWIVSEEDPK